MTTSQNTGLSACCGAPTTTTMEMFHCCSKCHNSPCGLKKSPAVQSVPELVRELSIARDELGRFRNGESVGISTDIDTFNFHGKVWEHFPTIAAHLLKQEEAFKTIREELLYISESEDDPYVMKPYTERAKKIISSINSILKP